MTELDKAIAVINKAVNINANTLDPIERDRLAALATNIHLFIRPRIAIIGQQEVIARIKMKVEKEFEQILDYTNKQIEHKFRPNREFEIDLPNHWAGDEALQTRVLGEIGKAWRVMKPDWLHAKLTLRQKVLDPIEIDPTIFDPRKL